MINIIYEIDLEFNPDNEYRIRIKIRLILYDEYNQDKNLKLEYLKKYQLDSYPDLIFIIRDKFKIDFIYNTNQLRQKIFLT